MQITIRNPIRKVVSTPGNRKVIEVLRELNLNPESHLVLRDDELLTSDELLLEDDTIEILSAISGGEI